MPATPDDLLQLLHRTADAVSTALASVTDWGPSGRRDGQYAADLSADAAALGELRAAGVGVLSEESGIEGLQRDIVVVVDPLDGSANASRGIPWFATSLCALDAQGPVAAVVADQAGGRRYWATRGGGAFRDGKPVHPSATTAIGDSVIGLSGFPGQYFGWSHYRALGAAALDLCLVADGTLDGYVDCSRDAHGVWDYAGAWLVCVEAGAVMADGFDRSLIVRDHAARRTPVAGATPELLRALVAARRAL